MKQCFKCKQQLPLTEFYTHSEMADGHLNKCKSCTKLDVARHRQIHAERIRAYDRAREMQPHRVKMRKRITAEWIERFPQRRAAHNAVRRAMLNGKLQRPQQCERCGDVAKIEAHHHEYTKPLSVQWLCKPCHAKADKERRITEF